MTDDQQKAIVAGLPGVALLIAMAVGYFGVCRPIRRERNKPVERHYLSEAIANAKTAVRRQLEPRPAKFPFLLDGVDVKTNDEETLWVVTGYVDTVNAFNAPVRFDYGVRMTLDDGKWTLEDVVME